MFLNEGMSSVQQAEHSVGIEDGEAPAHHGVVTHGANTMQTNFHRILLLPPCFILKQSKDEKHPREKYICFIFNLLHVCLKNM
jgi:hypothetical protein